MIEYVNYVTCGIVFAFNFYIILIKTKKWWQFQNFIEDNIYK